MRHYLLVLFHALDNPPFPNAKYKCDIINWGIMMRIITSPLPPFPNTNYNVAFVLCIWKGFSLLKHKITPVSNVGILLCIWKVGYSLKQKCMPANITLSTCKLEFQHYLLGLFYALVKKNLSKCKVQMRHY
jgi:hypothetical protein